MSYMRCGACVCVCESTRTCACVYSSMGAPHTVQSLGLEFEV
jgi:hypothetical protein